VELGAALLLEFRGGPTKMPAARIAQLRSALAALGLTPADRTKVNAEFKPRDDDTSCDFKF